MATYYNPVRVVWGVGQLNKLPDLVQSCHGKKLLLLTGFQSLQKAGHLQEIQAALTDFEVKVCSQVPSNPDVADIAALKQETDPYPYDLILAIGGGSVIDAAKALVALRGIAITAAADVREAIAQKRYGLMDTPLIAVPTTAGTGSEVTSWATVWDREAGAKYSIEALSLYPKVALVTPELTLGLSAYMTAASALDALSHATEAYWSKRTNEIVRIYALQAIRNITTYLEPLLADLTNLTLRQKIACGSLYAGLAFSNTKTTACHSISYPLTLAYNVNHGVAVSLTLAKMLAINESALVEKKELYAALNITTPEDLECYIQRIFALAHIPARLKDYGAAINKLEEIAAKCFTPGRMDNNPVDLTKQEMITLLEDIY